MTDKPVSTEWLGGSRWWVIIAVLLFFILFGGASPAGEKPAADG